MSGPRDPWADPGTPTEQGSPYVGPPPTAPGQPYGHPYGAPSWGQPPYGYPPVYGPPPYGAPWAPLPPRPPQRPGQAITAAVLAFVQAALVLIASLYVWFFASLAEFAARESGSTPARLAALVDEGTVLAVLGLVSAVLLVVAGVLSLNRRTRGVWLLLLLAHAVQVVLSLYWAIRLHGVFSDVPGADGEGAFATFSLFFAAGPLTSLGLLLLGAGRVWFTGERQASAGTAP